LIREVKGQQYVDLDGVAPVVLADPTDEPDSVRVGSSNGGPETNGTVVGANGANIPSTMAPPSDRVFITHGKNLDIVNQLKELLSFGKFVPVVAAEHETVSKPVPDKVMDEMRTCYAAIIHVGKEIKVLDQEGKEQVFINQNVLIEIGAAMALYGRRFILLVERGAHLPSNLQGLYEVRYEGDKLDYDATMKLLKAFNEFRS
jgi:predicted nucleotide-binding protein